MLWCLARFCYGDAHLMYCLKYARGMKDDIIIFELKFHPLHEEYLHKPTALIKLN